jgi:U3 small nucleolar RNA-associated protein 13
MASRISVKTTFEPARTIEPIYTGGDVCLDRSGRLLATCVEEDALVLNIHTGERMFRIENDGESITSLALAPAASHLVICSRSLSMRIYELNAPIPKLQRTLKPHTTPVITSTIDATSTLLATGGADGTIKVWDIRGGYTTHTFHGHSGVISALCFFQCAPGRMTTSNGWRKSASADHNMADAPSFFLASGGEDGKIRIWNLQTRKSISSLDSHVSVVKALAFTEQQQTLLSASRDKTIILWDSKSWKARKVIPVLEVVEAAGFLPDSSYCYSGGENGKVRIWSTSSGQEVTKEQMAGNESDGIGSIQCAPNYLLSVHLDQTIQLHDLSVLEKVIPGNPIDPLPLMRRISGNHDEVIDMAIVGPERSLLALATNTESIRLISIAESATDSFAFNFGADVALLSGHSEIIICIDVDWSGHWLATGAKDNTARLWRLDPSTSSYTCAATFQGHAESLGAIALPRMPPSSQAGLDPLNHPPAFLLTGSQDRTIKRWDTSNLNVSSSAVLTQSISKSLYTRVAHEKDINALDVSSTSSLFASASQDRTIKIWHLESGSVTGILRGHKRGVWSIRFAPHETPAISTDSGTSSKGLLVSGSGDRTVKLWSLSTYTCILTFEGHGNSVLKVLWLSPPPAPTSNQADADMPASGKSPQQTHPIIASASSDTLIKLWSPYSTSSPSSSSSSSSSGPSITTNQRPLHTALLLASSCSRRFHFEPRLATRLASAICFFPWHQ